MYHLQIALSLGRERARKYRSTWAKENAGYTKLPLARALQGLLERNAFYSFGCRSNIVAGLSEFSSLFALIVRSPGFLLLLLLFRVVSLQPLVLRVERRPQVQVGGVLLAHHLQLVRSSLQVVGGHHAAAVVGVAKENT